MDEGRQIARSDEQLSNADAPRWPIPQLDVDSNDTFERFQQFLKQPGDSVVIDCGIRIDFSKLPSKADWPRIEILHPSSKLTEKTQW
jgi:hypothetical protein